MRAISSLAEQRKGEPVGMNAREIQPRATDEANAHSRALAVRALDATQPRERLRHADWILPARGNDLDDTDDLGLAAQSASKLGARDVGMAGDRCEHRQRFSQ